MLSFFKVLLRGVVCTVLLPVILLVWVLYGVYCLVLFVLMFVKGVIGFFKGESIKGEMKEDIEAKRMLLEKQQAQENAQQMMSMMYQNAMAQMQAQQPMQQTNFMTQNQPVESAPVFEEEAPAEESSFEEENTEGGNDNANTY